MPLLTLDLHVPFIQLMKRHIEPQDHFTEIAMEGNMVVTTADSRALLHRIGSATRIYPVHGPPSALDA